MRSAKLAYLAAGLLASAAVAKAADPPKQLVAQLITTSAEVQKVDLKKHTMTLKDSTGAPFTVRVPSDVSRLEAVQPGDRVDVGFYESIALSLHKQGEAAPPSETQFQGRAAGKLPGGITGQQLTASAEVTGIDLGNHQLTIKLPDGEPQTVAVQDPANQNAMSRLKVGDHVQLTYTEAVAMSVAAATKGAPAR
jgi:hypothetical protein